MPAIRRPPSSRRAGTTFERVTATEETTPLEATLEAVGTALLKLERRDNWLLWIDLATPLPPWNVPEEFLAPYFTEEPIEDEEEGAEVEAVESEPLTPVMDPATGPIDPDDDPLYLSVQTSYAAAVTYLDAGVGQLLEALDNLEGGDELLLVFTSDVGQNLGEHGAIGPVRAWLHDEIVHLPLLVRLPAGAEVRPARERLTQAVDLAATLADWFRRRWPAPTDAACCRWFAAKARRFALMPVPVCKSVRRSNMPCARWNGLSCCRCGRARRMRPAPRGCTSNRTIAGR